MTTIDHTQHDHPATKAARELCRRELSRYPEPERPGSVFRSEDGSLWQRLLLTPADIERGDVIAGFDVVGTSTDARHDNEPAFRFDLVQDEVTGRLVVQQGGADIQAYRPYDPDHELIEVDIDVQPEQATGTDPASVMNHLFEIIDGSPVKPHVLTWEGPGDGHPIVRLTGPRKDIVAALKRHDPEDWEEFLVANVVEPEPTQGFHYSLLKWQRDRLEAALEHSAIWTPEPLRRTPGDGVNLPRNPWNQEVKVGFTLTSDATDTLIHVGREMMKLLMSDYPERLSLPGGFRV